jgi:hypothetical protein
MLKMDQLKSLAQLDFPTNILESAAEEVHVVKVQKPGIIIR